MRRVTSFWRHSAVQAFTLVAFLPLLLDDVPLRASDVDDAQQQIRSALKAQVDGDTPRRDALLRQTLERSPDCAPARWHLAQVHADGRWWSLPEIERLRAEDPRLAEYRGRRTNTAAVAQDQLALANWCRNSGLLDEERVHLLATLQLEPGHKVALQRLGLRPYHGEWLPQAEIDRRTQQARQLKKGIEQWKPIVIKWRRSIEEGTATQRQDALRQIQAVNDPAAYPVLEKYFSEHDSQLGQQVVALLAKTSRQEATESLVRHAVFCRFADVRASATKQLKPRPLHDYVPLLLAGMASLIQSHSEMSVGAGNAWYQHTVAIKGPYEDVYLTYNAIVRSCPTIPLLTDVSRSLISPQSQTLVSPGPMPNLMQFAAAIEDRVRRENAARTRLNERLQQVLRQTAGVNLDSSPETWLDWWQQYNEYESPGEKPVRFVNHGYSLNRPYAMFPVGRFSSCLAKGTQVWTQTGMASIECLRMGDKVLSQDPNTGELTHKLVLHTTIRQPGAMLRIGLGGDTLTTTLGHPFWVIGKGWQMAKQLQVGQRLHTATGSVTIDNLKRLEPDSAYNLVVEDFNTYFVGPPRVLVHDNTPRKPTPALLPGLLPDSIAIAQAP